MSRYLFFSLLLIGTVSLLACAGGLKTDPATPGLTGQVATSDGHQILASFDVVFDEENGTAEIVWTRAAEGHFDVTAFMQPPSCYDCVVITDAAYHPYLKTFDLEVQFRNPKNLVGYDVRAVLSNPGGNKFLINPDGVTQNWGPPMQFVAIGDMGSREFPPQSSYKTWFYFYYPDGENWQTVSYLIDAHYPGHVPEPLIEDGQADDLVNNNYSTAGMRCHVWDHQGGILSATADLLALGGSPMSQMYDDGQHGDGVAGDGIYGVTGVKTSVPIGMYMVNVVAMDNQYNMGMGQIPVKVVESTGGPNDDPIIQGVDVSRSTAKGPNEKINIAVTAVDPNGDSIEYEFQAESGMFSGQDGGEVTWTPSASKTGPQLITVNIYDPKGGQDSVQFHLYSTSMAIINGSTDGKIPSGTLECAIPDTSINMTVDFKSKVLYINFWATWCPYCIQELPDLSQVYNTYKSNPGYRQVMVDVGEDKPTVINFVNQYGYSASYWALDPSSSYFEKCNDFNGGSGGIPQHVLFDRDGNCRWSQVGMLSSTSELENAIDQLL